jgi:hypothetical protein
MYATAALSNVRRKKKHMGDDRVNNVSYQSAGPKRTNEPYSDCVAGTVGDSIRGFFVQYKER